MKFVENLKICLSAASLGVRDQLVRLALRIEDVEDIIADLKQALNEI